jgi:hypothetical protein
MAISLQYRFDDKNCARRLMVGMIGGMALQIVLLVGLPAHGAVYYVGPEMQYEKPSEVAGVAEDGDTIQIEVADYVGDVAVWEQNNLTFRGVGGRPHLIADGQSAESKAIWVIKGDNNTVENIEFSGAKVEDQNGAGIRLEGTNLTIRMCYFHHNENGILTGANPDSEILIEHSEFARNGAGDGYSHNMYIGVIARFTLRFSYVHGAKAGHQVKSRARANYILHNRLMDGREGTSSYLVDLPNPGKAFVIGNEMQQGPMAENWAMIRSIQELVLVNNTLVNDRSNGVFVALPENAESSFLQNNLLVGPGDLEAGEAYQRKNLRLANPVFASRVWYDYRLRESSPAIDQGSPSDASIVPVEYLQFEYQHAADRSDRTIVGVPDVGAHEFNPQRKAEY